MGLNYPEDLDAWRRWQRSRNRLRTIKATLKKPTPVDLVVLTNGGTPNVLVALDATTPSALAAVLRPATHLPAESIAVLAPRAVGESLLRDGHLPGSSINAAQNSWQMAPTAAEGVVPDALHSVRAVLSAGHFLAAGAEAYRWSQSLKIPYCVVQHGLLTPFAPPLPGDVTLFGFSDSDGEFWASGRSDVQIETVGSQMLWDAAEGSNRAESPAAESLSNSTESRPVFLGQLHGAELPRRISAATVSAFCAETGASYRPHPAETDRLSRWQHKRWQKRGIEVESTAKPLISGRPVVAVFSTGVLEAAAAGMPAWVTCATPPAWVEEFWDRYGLSKWGDAPTPRPALPTVEPSLQIATRLQDLTK